MKASIVAILFISLCPRASEARCGRSKNSSVLYDVTVFRCSEFDPWGVGPTPSAGLWLETHLHTLAPGDWEELRHLADLNADQLGARDKPSSSAEFYVATKWRVPSCDVLTGKRLRIFSNPPCCDVHPSTQPACYYHRTPLSDLPDVSRLDAANLEKRNRLLFLPPTAIKDVVSTNEPAIQKCHLRASMAGEDYGASEGLLMSWRIGTDGRPYGVRLGGLWGAARSAFAACLKKTIATEWSFPPSDSETVVVEYELHERLSQIRHHRTNSILSGWRSLSLVIAAILGAGSLIIMIFPRKPARRSNRRTRETWHSTLIPTTREDRSGEQKR